MKRTSMNHPSSLGRLGPLPNGPLPHLIRARREKTPQIHHLPHGRDNFRQRALGPQLLALLLGLLFILEPREAFLEADGERDDGVARGVFFDPFGDFGEVFVFLADVVFFAEVDEVDDWFCGEEEEGVDHFDLIRSSRQ